MRGSSSRGKDDGYLDVACTEVPIQDTMSSQRRREYRVQKSSVKKPIENKNKEISNQDGVAI